MTPAQLELLSSALLQAQGLILITGPTGSGKTNTLYAGIQQVSTPDRNIVTLEDPVEVQVAASPRSRCTSGPG
jgi:type IV pilus assembly protein PilB